MQREYEINEIRAIVHDQEHGWLAEISWCNTYEPLNDIPADLVAQFIRENPTNFEQDGPERFVRNMSDTQSTLTSLSDSDTQSPLTSLSDTEERSDGMASETEENESLGSEHQSDGDRSPEIIILSEDGDVN